MCERRDFVGMSLSFILGAAIGAGAALLLAPQSGEETRKKIKEYGEKAYETGKSKVSDVVAKAKSRMHHGEESVEA